MLKKVRIENSGDTDFLPGTLVDVLEYEDMNEALFAEGKELADGKQVLSADIDKAAAQRGISARTVRTAKQSLGNKLVSERSGAQWMLSLKSE